MEQLPIDVIRLILDYLDSFDLRSMCMLNRNFNYRICNDKYWLSRLCSDYDLTKNTIDKYRKHNSYAAYYFALDNKINRHFYLQGDLFISAAETDRIDIISIIFDNISNIEYCLGRGLLEASKRGHYETVNYLINRGADVNYIWQLFDIRTNSLIVAVKNNHIDVVRLLLDKGVDVNALGGSAVHIALANQNDIMAKLLIKRGALVGPNWVVQAQHLA